MGGGGVEDQEAEACFGRWGRTVGGRKTVLFVAAFLAGRRLRPGGCSACPPSFSVWFGAAQRSGAAQRRPSTKRACAPGWRAALRLGGLAALRGRVPKKSLGRWRLGVDRERPPPPAPRAPCNTRNRVWGGGRPGRAHVGGAQRRRDFWLTSQTGRGARRGDLHARLPMDTRACGARAAAQAGRGLDPHA